MKLETASDIDIHTATVTTTNAFFPVNPIVFRVRYVPPRHSGQLLICSFVSFQRHISLFKDPLHTSRHRQRT